MVAVNLQWHLHARTNLTSFINVDVMRWSILRLIWCQSANVKMEMCVKYYTKWAIITLRLSQSPWYASCCVTENWVNRPVYTTIISTDKIDTNVSTFVYCAKAFATCFDLHKAIIMPIYRNSILVLELCFIIWTHIITIFYHFTANTTLMLK
jgi:hypothetical protein